MTIELSPYNPDWPYMFTAEKELISANFPEKDFSIEHIGSTAVSGLKAKPVIDILIGLSPSLPADITPIANHLRVLGYKYIEKYNLMIPERRYFTKEVNGKPTHHIHIVAMHSDFWNRHLFFRDQLRENPAIREQYERLKTDLAKQQWNSGNDYADAKSDFIRSIEKRRAAHTNISPI
ncbi:MAG: GrpB family protein [Bacteroidia bacterium]